MKRKIPEEAFAYYAALGRRRSFQAIAERYGVTRQAVSKRAYRECWDIQVARLDEAAQAITKEDLLRLRCDTYERHTKMWTAVQGKALEALRDKPFRHGLDAVRALETANVVLASSLFMQESARLSLAAVTGENIKKAMNDDASGVDSLTDNQLLRRAAEFEAALERVRAAKSRPPGANA
ncbi:MAG: hypothetical protein IT381_14805 [Deltaproteobacteria bacterium]|nr:hypothetical protein [Deltaproteobacteria bacterium]